MKVVVAIAVADVVELASLVPFPVLDQIGLELSYPVLVVAASSQHG